MKYPTTEGNGKNYGFTCFVQQHALQKVNVKKAANAHEKGDELFIYLK